MYSNVYYAALTFQGSLVVLGSHIYIFFFHSMLLDYSLHLKFAFSYFTEVLSFSFRDIFFFPFYSLLGNFTLNNVC